MSDPDRSPREVAAVVSSPAGEPEAAENTGGPQGGEDDHGIEAFPAETGRFDRTRAHIEAGRRRVDSAYLRLRESRSRVSTVDVAFNVQEGDRDAGGSLLGGALAFRMFLWLLPAALLVVSGLGFDSAEDPTGPSGLVRAVGIKSIAAQSIDQAAQESQSARWLVLILGAIFLYTTSVALVKALFVAHALIWQIPVPKVRHKPRVAGELLGAFLVMAAATSVAAVIRSRTPGYGLVAMLAVVFVYMGVWWVWSMRLPHAEGSAVDLIPGAILFGVGVQTLHLVAVYYLATKLTHASALYGSLGIAAALLFGMYLFGRLIVAAVVLNVAVWVRKQAKTTAVDGGAPPGPAGAGRPPAVPFQAGEPGS